MYKESWRPIQWYKEKDGEFAETEKPRNTKGLKTNTVTQTVT